MKAVGLNNSMEAQSRWGGHTEHSPEYDRLMETRRASKGAPTPDRPGEYGIQRAISRDGVTLLVSATGDDFDDDEIMAAFRDKTDARVAGTYSVGLVSAGGAWGITWIAKH